MGPPDRRYQMQPIRATVPGTAGTLVISIVTPERWEPCFAEQNGAASPDLLAGGTGIKGREDGGA